MKIQFNTDKTIVWDQRHDKHFAEIIKEELDRFSDHITRVEVHLSDENGAKEGNNDIRCLIEVRLEGRKPFAITNQSNSSEKAVSGAINKVKASLKTILERMHQ